MISQEDRLGILHAPGTDLALVRFSAQEGVNQVGQITLECLDEMGGVDFTDLLGRNITVEMRTIDAGHASRFYDGLLTDARDSAVLWGGQGYQLTLRPWLWLLGLRRNQRIFHRQTVPQILEAIFADYGYGCDNRLQASYPELEYTVQYAETDLDFAIRMMATAGINYTFVHTQGSHELTLFDDVDSLPMVPGKARQVLHTDRQYRETKEHLHSWRAERRVAGGRVSLVDYNFKTPRAAMDAEQVAGAGHAHDDLESFLFPGGYLDQGAGKTLAETRLKQMISTDGHHFAQGDCAGLAAGMRMALSGHPNPEIDGKTYVVLDAKHEYIAEGYRSGTEAVSERDSYQGQYEFVDSTRPVAPSLIPVPPRVQGPQTAIVVGQGEIDCDEYGRILVRFHWDRDDAKSMRCRVAQMSAGKNWGGIVIPRIGMEVLVEFLNGDPSQPLVTGCVYNEDNKPPFDLPGAGQVMGMKTNSTPGGDGYNELALDDTKGNEEMRLHAQYNLNAKVLHDQAWQIDNNCSTTVGVNDANNIGKDRTTEIGKTDTLEIGETLEITAGQKITLKVGSSTLTMTPNKITLESPTIEIKASMEFKSGAGMLSEHKAGAIFDIKGALVKINT